MSSCTMWIPAWYKMTSERNIFNHLYKNYDHGIIKEVRFIEKLELRLAKHKTARSFNLGCLQEKVIPSGCKIKFKSKNKQFLKENNYKS